MQDTERTVLHDNYIVEALEGKPNGEIVHHMLTKADINEIFRKKQFTESFLESANKKIDQITDNLSSDGWYSKNVDKAEVLRDLCEILGHEAKQTLNWVATIRVEGATDVPIEEVGEFDLRYFLSDELSVDIFHGDTVINSHYVETIDEEEWD